MPTWKKVIVSGSSAELTGITSSVLTNDNLLIAGNAGQIENSGLTYNGTTLSLGGSSITSTGTGTVLTGSFAGTFSGSVVVNQQDLTNSTGITSFTYDGNSPATVSVSGASNLNTNAVTKWTGAAFANTAITDNGSVITTTTPLNVGGAITASGAISSSAGLLGTTLTATSNATVGGTLRVTNALTASIISASSGITGSLFGTSSWATNAQTASFLPVGTYSITSSWAQSASNAINARTASFLPVGTYSITSSWAQSASNAINAQIASNISPAITNNTDNRVLTATGGGTINGESNLTFDGTTLTVTGNTVISNNLTVQGTASFQETTNLTVADRFILLASGSGTSPSGDGGIVIQQTGSQGVGEAFGWDATNTSRWGVTSSFSANQAGFTPDAFMALAIIGSGTAPTSVAVRYSASGNLFIGTDETIWIYS
jgi:hypothetical protein